MKNTIEIFDEYLRLIKNMLEQSNYYGCTRIARKLTTVSTMSGFKDGVLISEVCEGIFDQLDDVVKRYKVDEEKLKKIDKLLIELTNTLVEVMKNDSKEKLYEVLKEMRYSVTEFQINSFDTAKPLHVPKYSSIVGGLG